jgi:nucleotide-binding universal stress UspA family protein
LGSLIFANGIAVLIIISAPGVFPDPYNRKSSAENFVRAEITEKPLREQASGKSVPIETLVVWGGNPPSEICVFAARQGVDLIVMGTHGRTGLAHMLIGSVAERVVRHAPCSVLTVRAPRTEKVS